MKKKNIVLYLYFQNNSQKVNCELHCPAVPCVMAGKLGERRPVARLLFIQCIARERTTGLPL